MSGCSAGGSNSEPTSAGSTVPSGTADTATKAAIGKAVDDAMAANNLKALIVRVTKDGQDVYTAATGESMTGVPATPDMHFRSGAFGFMYIGEIFAKLVDAKKVSLDDKLSTWFPDYPRADQITIKNLLNMTSGYADYVYQPEMLASSDRDPFRQWSDDELIALGLNGPEQFAPGTNWGYSHTNYVILAKVLEQITGKPMADVMAEYVLEPMKLTQTGSNGGTPAIPEPALHSFTSERAEYLNVPPGTPFYEEATYWNPSWTTAKGAVITTTITDMTSSMEIVGSGSQVSKEMYEAQTGPNLVGFGTKDPTGVCSSCRPNTEAMSYGLGIWRLGPWLAQNASFAGLASTSGYLPSEKLTVSVAMTYLPAAFADADSYGSSSWTTFAAVADAVAPGQGPKKATG
ncbi:MAG: serine hydrolase domain-containing protein [Candidatus Nanopelagicales bacterium]